MITFIYVHLKILSIVEFSSCYSTSLLAVQYHLRKFAEITHMHMLIVCVTVICNLCRENDCSAAEKDCTWEDAFDEDGNTSYGDKVS